MSDKGTIVTPTDSLMIVTMRMAFVAESTAIILNILLIFTFIYQVNRERNKLSKAFKGKKPEYQITNSQSSTSSQKINENKTCSKRKRLNKESVYITYLLLFVGFLFSICQGLIENWLTIDCGAPWLQWITLFFYVLHRDLLLFAFLHRLYYVFKESAYSYSNTFYYILLILIIIHWISSYFIYSTNHDITYVDIKMYTGYSGNIICSWSFGVLISGIARPIEIVLMLILCIAFLYKLWQLHMLTNKYSKNDEMKKTNKLLVVFRKITFLTLAAIITTVVVQFGYIAFKPLSAAISLDSVFNSFCVFLMFQFNHKIIRPCFGYKCDRLCCIKFKGICKCKMVGCSRCNNKNDENEENQTIETKSGSNISGNGDIELETTETTATTLKIIEYDQESQNLKQ